uniref:Uncharacterized protein n=1 Tax=Opuntia streptacantha TaxID=393608 RepID=A0A7C8ZPK2_OPUST
MIILVFIVGETGIILPCTVRSGCTFKTLILHTFMLPPTSDSDIGLVQDSSLTYSLLAAVERRARSSCLENVCGFLEYSSTLFFLQFNWCLIATTSILANLSIMLCSASCGVLIEGLDAFIGPPIVLTLTGEPTPLITGFLEKEFDLLFAVI